VPNVCIVFTDGKSTGKPRSKGFVPIPETVEFLTDVKNVHMLAVGIGRGIKDTELKILAGDKGHYVHAASFSQLFGILEKLKDAACGQTGYNYGGYYSYSFGRRFKNVPRELLADRRMR